MAALMTSNKKCEANRLCAQKSTGPKSERGKRHSSLNALRHGIFAESPAIPGEDLDEYAELADTFFAERAPQGVTETFLASEMVRDIWGVKRLNGAEKTFLEQIQKTVQGRNKRRHFSGDIEKMSVREAAAAYARTLRDGPFEVPICPPDSGSLSRSDVRLSERKAVWQTVKPEANEAETLGLTLLEANVAADERFPIVELDRRRRKKMQDFMRKHAFLDELQEQRATISHERPHSTKFRFQVVHRTKATECDKRD